MGSFRFRAFACVALLCLLSGLSLAATNPTKFDLTSAEKSQIVAYLNSSSEAELTAIGLSSTAVRKVITVRPFSSWDVMWATTSVGSDANAELIMIELELLTEIQGRIPSKACIRTRPEDRGRIVSWFNSASVASQTRIAITASGQAKIAQYRPFANWKAVLRRFSDSDLKKVGIEVGAVRYVSGSTAIERISGIGTVYGAKFRTLNILTTQTLLAHAVWPSWRAELAQKTALPEALITRFAKRADLMRISGCGEQYGDLLAYAGVETVPDLATKNATTLRAAMIEMNVRYNLVNTIPSQTTVTNWIIKARTLPRFLEL